MVDLKNKVKGGMDFSSGMTARKLNVYAASGCYYMFMSLVPSLMLICCILPYTPFNKELVLSLVDTYFLEELGQIMRRIVNAIYSSSGATITISLVLTLYSASASMRALMGGMDAAYNITKKDNIIKHSIRSLIYMLFLIVSILLSLGIMVYGGEILEFIRPHLPQLPKLAFLNGLLSNARFLLAMVVLAVFFTVLYTIMPTERVHMKDQIPGAIFTAVIWVIFSSVFSIYVAISDKFGAYGFIGTIMVCMMWMYYCFFFLLIGGYINSYLTEKRKR